MKLLGRHRAQDLVCFGGDGERTAAQLAAYAQAIARALPDGELGSRVVLACVDRYHFSAALTAIWLRGYVAELPANGQAGTVQALSDRALSLLHDREGLLGIDVRTLEDATQRAATPIALQGAEHEIAAVAYTSGSTGQPTPHEKTFRQLLSESSAHVDGFALAGERIVSAVPPFHIYGLLFGVLVPLLGGGSTSREAPLQPAEVLRAVQDARVLIAVPPHLAALATYQAGQWPAMKRVFSSAAPLPAQIARALGSRGWPVTEVLGSTETGGIAHRSAPDAPWEPLHAVRVEVDDEARLWVEAPWCVRQRTNDRVERTEDGFRHLGRSDAVVKIGGRRVDLGEVEARLKERVRDARVLAVESKGVRGVELWAVLESDGVDLEALRRELRAHVDPVAVPRRFRVVAALPRSATGKVQRSALLALFDVWAFPRTDGEHVRFQVPKDSGYFRGHFEDQPILPGVVQLQYFALAEARRRYPELRALRRVVRVKFRRLLVPGETLVVLLTRKSETVVQFVLETDAGLPAASGIMHFAAAP
ncbi:MAG TPA: AMP-binding protein [Polyangiales bacterium]|nr:AMP-binding protein [Polyangiales bacterium]